MGLLPFSTTNLFQGQSDSLDNMFLVGIRDVRLNHVYVGCPQFLTNIDFCYPLDNKIPNVWSPGQPDNVNGIEACVALELKNGSVGLNDKEL
ncbi:hypothetical protein B566_EDAN017479 [Ephemera danica]|nr:hypothetical protein B566_EDAN017479 [Ephemera danica]